jgi:putative two-component system response regulator
VTQVLIVDGNAALRTWECRVLEAQRYSCIGVPDAPEARAALSEGTFELALLDVNLPGESGISLLSEIHVEHPQTAVLMITGEDNFELATMAIELGAYGYLVRPLRAGELLINVANALHRRQQEANMMRHLARLESGREQAEAELRTALHSSGDPDDSVRLLENDTVHRLVRLAEFRDEDTGRHLLRMSRYCELIGLALGHDAGWSAALRLASELHDVGKVAIPDRILLKPGYLTDSERAVMRKHAEIGYALLADSESELLKRAAVIALTHHERWDGEGYPQGVAGEKIPIDGRIAAVADVFDALTSNRAYRPAFPVGLALEMMEAERGRHFDHDALDGLAAAFDRIDAVRQTLAD